MIDIFIVFFIVDICLYSFMVYGQIIEDFYVWLKDLNYFEVDDVDVFVYLKVENVYFEVQMVLYMVLIDMFYEEMKVCIKEDEMLVLQKDGDWFYWIVYVIGGQYKIWWCKFVVGGDDELLFDELVLVEGYEYFWFGVFLVSNDGCYLVYVIDDNGFEWFEVWIKDLIIGEYLFEVILGMLLEIVWIVDDVGFFYGLVNEQWWIDNVCFYWLGMLIDQDVVLFYEEDEGFCVGVGEMSLRKWIVIVISDYVISEFYLFFVYELLLVLIFVLVW